MSEHKKARRIGPALVVGVIGVAFVGTLIFLWKKSRPAVAGVETEKPFVADIVKKAVAAGAIEPRKEIEIKPRVAGILRKVHVEPGAQVKAGDLIAEVQIIPDPMSLNEAHLRLESARLSVARTKRELDRAEALGAKGATTFTELDRLRADFEQAKEELRAAEARVRLVREGSIGREKSSVTRVEATVGGTVLAVPVKEGASVINANSFNAGTTVATVADMTDMIFRGTVDESEVGRIKEGMPVEIVVGALNDRTFPGTLELVSPKSLAKEGTTEFEIEAAFRPPEGTVVRAGYSANANIVLGKREQVLAIHESVLLFDGDRRMVDVQVGPGRFEKREVKLGLSDGVKVEVQDGISPDAVLRRPSLEESVAQRGQGRAFGRGGGGPRRR